eukprot:SAG11_NODE_2332_length_3506_cov_2.301732_4_plen_121_part_00
MISHLHDLVDVLLLEGQGAFEIVVPSPHLRGDLSRLDAGFPAHISDCHERVVKKVAESIHPSCAQLRRDDGSRLRGCQQHLQEKERVVLHRRDGRFFRPPQHLVAPVPCKTIVSTNRRRI